MGTINPYAAPSDTTSSPSPKRGKSIIKRLFFGFCIGASIPAALGAYGLYQLNNYVASFPSGESACGYGVLGPLMLIMFGAPLLGLIGAAVAAATP